MTESPNRRSCGGDVETTETNKPSLPTVTRRTLAVWRVRVARCRQPAQLAAVAGGVSVARSEREATGTGGGGRGRLAGRGETRGHSLRTPVTPIVELLARHLPVSRAHTPQTTTQARGAAATRAESSVRPRRHSKRARRVVRPAIAFAPGPLGADDRFGDISVVSPLAPRSGSAGDADQICMGSAQVPRRVRVRPGFGDLQG
jgi:hypothetical protein